jgi:hypothetical protein
MIAMAATTVSASTPQRRGLFPSVKRMLWPSRCHVFIALV